MEKVVLGGLLRSSGGLLGTFGGLLVFLGGLFTLGSSGRLQGPRRDLRILWELLFFLRGPFGTLVVLGGTFYDPFVKMVSM